MSIFQGGPPNLPPELLLQLLSQQQGQQPAEQMSQQGQFNPADIQAQLSGGPQPFSFAPVPGGLGRNIINALANAGKAATYVAEDPRERQADDARAQQLYETKQKMAMAAGEFGQREKDRAAAAAESKQRFTQQELDRKAQLQIANERLLGEAPHTLETDKGPIQWDAKTRQWIPVTRDGQPVGPKTQAKPDTPEQQFFDSPEEQGKTMAQKVADYAKFSQKPEQPQRPQQQLVVDPRTNKFVEARPGMDYAPGMMPLGAETKQQQAIQGAQTDINFANNYIQSKKFDGPHDEALIEKFFDMTKPSSGFRMTQAQIDMALKARSALQGIVAQGKHFLSPNAPYLDDTQRQNIVQTMNDVMTASQSARPSPQGSGAPPPAADPFAPFGGKARAPQR